MKMLHKKETRKIIDELEDYYGAGGLKMDCIFLKNNKNKIFIISKDFKSLDARDLRVNGLGLYFLNVSKGPRLSIEGSQIIGRKARKNVYEVEDNELSEWLKGYDLKCDESLKGYKIIRSNKDFYGVGFASNGKIKNFIPKERRIRGNV